MAPVRAVACFRGVAQFGSALRSGRRGRRFKSCHPDHSRNLFFNKFRLFILLNTSFYVILVISIDYVNYRFIGGEISETDLCKVCSRYTRIL